MTDADDQISDAVAQGGTYDLIRKRLLDQVERLETATSELNTQREQAFGHTSLEVVSRVRVRTENNCVPRDIVTVGDRLLFGYNVFIGLKKETAVSDVFAAYHFTAKEGDFEITQDPDCEFLRDDKFQRDFHDLYSYYKAAHLVRMQVIGSTLYITFRIGDSLDDLRIFQWHVSPNGDVTYIDDRAERSIPRPPRHSFEWHQCGRDNLMERRTPAYSLDDQVFVEISKGRLYFKVEDNTQSGALLQAEALDEPNQTLDDARIAYARVSNLVLISALPYGETTTRYFVYDPLTQSLERHDDIGSAVRELPEDHGIMFPGGYYLGGGGSRNFDEDFDDLLFSRQINSPNGEDVLYVFYERARGRYGLYAYNLIRKSLETPIYANGYSLFADGSLVIFRSESSDPTRNHPMQIWQTSFFDEEHVVDQTGDSPLVKVGNNELVRGISDLLAIVQGARSEQVTIAGYTALITNCRRAKDAYFWLEGDDFGDLDGGLDEIAKTSELVLDEFEKVAEIRAHANKSLQLAADDQAQLSREIETSQWNHAREFVQALGTLRKHRGHLRTIGELRYIDSEQIKKLETQAERTYDELTENTVGFLLRDDALVPYRASIEEFSAKLAVSKTATQIKPIEEGFDELGRELDLLTEILGSLSLEDATKRTAILESISELFAALNAAKAKARNASKALGSDEARAEFAAQFTLFSQSITNALAQVRSPDDCDQQLARLTVALEELEGRFGTFDEFLPDIVNKREEMQDAFDGQRQSLIDERQRRAQSLFNAAERILEGIARRAARADSIDEINAHFSTDNMVMKLIDTVDQLRELEDTVKADDLQIRLKATQDNAVRALRDKLDIFESGGAVIKFGQHRFSVNQQSLELTMIPKDDALYVHLTGTSFAEQVEDERLNEYQALWQQSLPSETRDIYRSEYLAYQILRESAQGDALVSQELHALLLDEEAATAYVREAATNRYREGYEKGVHDHDALRILQAVAPRIDELGLLAYTPNERALALLFWHSIDDETARLSWRARAQTAAHLVRLYPGRKPYERIVAEVDDALKAFSANPLHGIVNSTAAARYLVAELSQETPSFSLSQHARDLVAMLQSKLHENGIDKAFKSTLDKADDLGTQFHIASQWLSAVCDESKPHWRRLIPEAAAHLLLPSTFEFTIRSADAEVSVKDLLGQHPRIIDNGLTIVIDEFLARLEHHAGVDAPRYDAYHQLRHDVAEDLRGTLNLGDFVARPLSSFVRNKLLNDVYLPIIGDNLAKQIGAADDAKRTDLMGLLLLISPPGYGKTTLMEYVADRLGLIFVKINGPALGHSVTSVDPEQAPNATARQELEKLNLSLEMGNNVMLYVDDIQHTNPEFLQKFISLCDGTRRIEGVWRKQPKTYDLRGRRFCVIMAGNPYTESGDIFQVPDMLANRADVYNLGDVLSGREEVFALSYIENSLTSNSVLAPLATRDMADVYRFVDRAGGREVADSDFSHTYSAAEGNEIISVLKMMQQVQRVVLAVNREYIASAATQEAFRTEPPFKLQGSYRNMNKLAEKILPIMNEEEIQALLDDHYTGELQLLTSEAEFNALRLAELRGRMSAEQTIRLNEIRTEYRRVKTLGGNDTDAATKLANQLSLIREALADLSPDSQHSSDMSEQLAQLTEVVRQSDITVVNQPSKVVEDAIAKLAETIETTFLPVVASMDKKIDLDLAMLRRVKELKESLDANESDTEQ